MLRFNPTIRKRNKQFILNFNTSYVTVQPFQKNGGIFFYVISIHPMLRFNLTVPNVSGLVLKFQYILCYGSTYLINNNFVGAKKFQYILCYGSTIIPFPIIIIPFLFQYILCYGSTFVMATEKEILFNFNTSYVTVQLWMFQQSTQTGSKFQYILCYGSTKRCRCLH